MTQTWHREEPREVRPFFAAIAAEEAIAESAVRLFSGGEVFTDSSFDLEEIDFQRLEATILPVLANPSQWMPDGLAQQDLEIVLIARHSFLKQSTVIARHSLADGEIPTEWAVSRDVLDGMAGGRNLELTLALCLATDRPPSLGSPFVAGHWLARKHFILRSRTNPSLFDLRTRTDEEWLAAGYPPKTFYAVEYAGGMADEMADGSSVATVYMHVDAHNRMVASPIGETLQPILASEIILSVLVESLDDWKDVLSPPPSSPLSTLLKQLSKEGTTTLEDLRKLVLQPSRARALFQDRLSVLKALK